MASSPDRRSTPRAEAAAWVTLTAVTCRQAAPGARIHATLTDVSRESVGIIADGKLWQGDRLVLSGRLFDIPLSANITVRVVRAGTVPGETVAGCTFVDLTGEQRVTLERILLGRLAQDDLGLGRRFAIG